MWAVSLMCMRKNQRYCLLLTLIAALVSTLSGATPCTPDGPLLIDKAGMPIWLDTDTLLKSATHCVAPQMPALARQAQVDGFVLIDILVDGKGKVACVQVVH